VRRGIDSASVNLDMVVWTRKIVASVEPKVILELTLKDQKDGEPGLDFDEMRWNG